MKREWNYFFEEIFFSFQLQDSICSPQLNKFTSSSSPQVGRTCCEAAAHGREGEKPFLEENFKALCGSWIYRTCLFVEAFASLEKQLTVGAKIFEMVFGGFTELPPNGNI